MSAPHTPDNDTGPLALHVQQLAIIRDNRYGAVTLRDIAQIFFRQGRLLLISFATIFLLAMLLSGAFSPTYRAEMRILVRHGRVDPVVTSLSSTQQLFLNQVTEPELNSEVELLNSQDLLRKVAIATNLPQRFTLRMSLGKEQSEQVKIEKAVRYLSNHMKAEPLLKTNMISVAFEAGDPELAAHVLNSLGILYLDKHSQVHRPAGEFNFFDRETEELRQSLALAENKLTQFTRDHGVVSAQYERDLLLQKASDLQASLAQTQSSIAEARKKIGALELQLSSIPSRVTTQLRTADNPQLLQQMKSTLLELELKRSELLSKFQPDYPPVGEVEDQINQARNALAAEQKAPVHDETTDRNPLHEWVRAELTKARTELSGLKARERSDQAILQTYRQNAVKLQQSAMVQQDLLRTAKTKEENYLRYSQKQEESRINEALDSRGILNVTITEPPSVPALPAKSFWSYAVLSLFLACVGSLGLVIVADLLDPSFRTPDELAASLSLPVFASILRTNSTSLEY